MTKSEALAAVCEYLDIIYSDTGDRPLWSQGLYKDGLFQIFAASYDCRIHGDQVWLFLGFPLLVRNRIVDVLQRRH